MGAEDPANRTRGGIDDGLDVRIDRGTRVDHRDPRYRVAEQIRVRARPGHHAGIRRGEPHDSRRDPHRHARQDLVGGGAFALRIELADLGVRVVARHEELRAVAPGREPRRHRRHRARRVRVVERVGDAGEFREQLERLQRREHELDVTARMPLQREVRNDPFMRHRLARVVHRPLVLGRRGDEEARVVAARPAGLGDPVREIGEPIGRQPHAERGDHRAERRLARVQRAPQARRVLARDRRVEVQQLVARVGVQEPCLLEALADRADPVGKTAGRDLEAQAGLRVVEPGA